MVLALHRPNGRAITVQLSGPAGEPTLLPQSEAVRTPSRDVATATHKRVVDTVSRLKQTATQDFAVHEYGVTDISDAFWQEWFAANQTFDVITQRMVFEV